MLSHELVNGELVDMGNSGMEHGGIGSYLGGLLAIYVRQNKLGIVCDSSTAFAEFVTNRPDLISSPTTALGYSRFRSNAIYSVCNEVKPLYIVLYRLLRKLSH